LEYEDELIVHRRGITPPEEDLEKRAVSAEEVRGTLPERIAWLALYKRQVEFDFQSSLLGGRLELGGMVADFILPTHMIIIRVQTQYWHAGLAATTKDQAQKSVLEGMGYVVHDLWEDIIFDARRLEDWMERYIDVALPSIGGGIITTGMAKKFETEIWTVMNEVLRRLTDLELRMDAVEAALISSRGTLVRNMNYTFLTEDNSVMVDPGEDGSIIVQGGPTGRMVSNEDHAIAVDTRMLISTTEPTEKWNGYPWIDNS
jgi:very-short-patch-repair endonuclease